MTQSSARVQQWAAKQDRDNLSLIPPLAKEFSLYGGPDTTERAREWALRHRYLLADGIPACAHGLYLLAGCPDETCRNKFRQLDHASIWVPAPADEYLEDGRPFLLSHPYAKVITQETRAYADAHGLRISSNPEYGEGWYHSQAIPIRMSLPESYPLWPIEAKAAVLLITPQTWPADDEVTP